ncbi:MAG: AsmA family protein [Steroidobacteraceae bacterium]
MPKKPLSIVLAAIAILALMAVALPWLGARTPFARNAASRWITEKTGLPATVASLRIGYFPGPSLVVGGLSIAQPPGFGDEPLLQIGQARVSMPWSSLFGAPAVESLSIAEAVARLIVAADGKDNWSALIDRLAEPGEAGEPAWSLDALEFEHGAVEYTDAASDSRWQLTAIMLTAEEVAPGAEFPALLQLAGVAGDSTFHFTLEGRARMDLEAARYEANGLKFRGWAGGEGLPLAGLELTGKLALASYDGSTDVAAFDRGSFRFAGIPGEFGGTLDLRDDGSRTVLSLKTGDFEPRRPAVAFGRPLPVTADENAFGSMQLSLETRIRDGVWQLDPVTGRLDDTRFHGRVVPEKRLIQANFDRVEVDRYLAPGQKKRRAKKETLEAAIARLGEFDIDAEIRIEEVRVAGARLRDTVVRVARDRVEVE